MEVIISQCFPLGRFHATRWRENPFADSYGEFPPSPWRLLRALAARWFQYSRETGDLDRENIEGLLRKLARVRPHFGLPDCFYRGPSLRQYQPTSDFAWSDPNAGSGAVKRSKTTLFPDPYFVLDPNQPVFWIWRDLDLSEEHRQLLGELLCRITYFGRAESLSRLQLTSDPVQANCSPAESDGNAPVLCFKENEELRLDALLVQSSDRGPGADLPVPPGTEWVLYRRPDSAPRQPKMRDMAHPTMHFVQFAMGGQVFPPEPLWIKVAERFRGRILKGVERESASMQLLSGKGRDGKILAGDHRHAYFVLWPDDRGNPTRLIVWRKPQNPFQPDELNALMQAAGKPIPWTNEKGGWTVQLVPLPWAMDLPCDMGGTSTEWISATPFVRPVNRHAVRPNGRQRPSEQPEEICARLIEKVWGIRPKVVERIDDHAPWMKLHESVASRQSRRDRGERTPKVGPGHRLRVVFEEPFTGPLVVGDSAHFGLGVFRVRRT